MRTVKTFGNDERGSLVSTWTTALIMIFTVVVVYALTYNMVCTTLYNLAITMAPVNTEAGYFNVLKLVRMVYNIFPWILIFGILIWSYLSSQRREFETGY